MAKARDPIEEIIEVMANMQAANNTALIALAKTLEDAGAMKVKDYKKALLHAAQDLAHNGALGPSALLEDLAEMMKRDEVKKQ
ncbi:MULTISPECIES: hypothetical protein [unclassified Rhizobium]|uniref:hypothetical protein n=1 Tax=unclassified Rhizobium TaxID=2613769 RepID=UPI002479E2CF|nr:MULTISPECIES: hypothetical protein [unclassified Rhizobium]MDH7801315.1 aminopeptidase N [Rhizobium sp. AN70]